MNKTIIIILCLVSAHVFGQSNDSAKTILDLYSQIGKIKSRVSAVEKANMTLQRLNSSQKSKIDSIASKLSESNLTISKVSDSLHLTKSSLITTNTATQNKLESINQLINSNTVFWILGGIVLIVLGVVAFIILKNKLTASNKTFDKQITKTNETIMNEAIKLDSKLVDILQTQLKILSVERKNISVSADEMEHKLPLKVGDEIHRMRKRIENMPKDVKGLSALTNSIQRLEEEFNESGYIIEELLGRKYVDGMKVEARFVDNPNIPKGEELITDVLRPQIMYNGTVIQVAKVEVGKSY